MNGKANTNKNSFQVVTDPNCLISILQERHPLSCFMQNQVITYSHFKDDITFYTFGPQLNSNTWIISIYKREKYSKSTVVSMSFPLAIVDGTQEIPLHIKEAFISEDLIKWGEGVLFAALPKPVSRMIFDISTDVKGFITEVHPGIIFYMDREDALNLEIKSPAPNVTVQRLLAEKDSDFIMSTWRYKEEADVPQCIEANASGGVFVDGKCVSGVITTAFGLLSALYTLKEYRGKGYAKLTMQYAIKETAKNGGIPCSNVETRNVASIAFHKSLGVKEASVIDWIEAKVLDVD